MPASVRALVAARVLFAAACVAAATGCAPPPAPPVSGVVVRGPSEGAPLRMTYLGTGGWILQRGEAQVLTAPLFSNPGFVHTGTGDIASDTAVVDRYMARYDVRDARAILVGHAHYDHLMDVPRVARAHAPRARIVGSETVRNTLGTWSGLMDRVDTVERSAGDEAREGPWMAFGADIRVLPLRSLHGPHFDGITLYPGTVDRPLERPPRRATEWLEGETFAYLIDFLDADGSVAFRIYYQDAVAPAPLGFAPEALMEARPVDVAVIVPATFEEVAWHPEALVRNLRPRTVLLGHWEDFFRPMDDGVVPVPYTDLGHFERRLARVFGGEVLRPQPFTEFRFGGG